MAIQDARQMFTNLLGMRQQRNENRANRLVSGFQFGADLLTRRGEARRQREFLAGESEKERAARASQSALERTHEAGGPGRQATANFDLMLKENGATLGVNDTPENIQAALDRRFNQEMRLRVAGRSQQNINQPLSDFERINQALREVGILRGPELAANSEDIEAWLNSLVKDVEIAFGKRPFTDAERAQVRDDLMVLFGLSEEEEAPPPPPPSPRQGPGVIGGLGPGGSVAPPLGGLGPGSGAVRRAARREQTPSGTLAIPGGLGAELARQLEATGGMEGLVPGQAEQGDMDSILAFDASQLPNAVQRQTVEDAQAVIEAGGVPEDLDVVSDIIERFLNSRIQRAGRTTGGPVGPRPVRPRR